MQGVSRRKFLRTMGLAAAGLGLGGIWPRTAHAAWGDIPASIWAGSGFDPANMKVLEIHLLGGVAPFESFYFRPSPGPQTRGFNTEVTNLIWNNPTCAGTPSGLETQFFANDTKGKPIHLGPFAKPLWSRTDIRDRMRVMVLSHNLLPHEAAIPFALTGLRLGNANQASLGAAISQRHQTLSPRALPYAYGLLPQFAGLNSLLATTMGAVGRHPGSTRPLVLRIGPGFATFLTDLQRSNMNATKDALLNQYRGQYRDWLRYQGVGPPTRSNAFRDYDTSVDALVGAASLSTFLGSIPTAIPNDAECARTPTGSFETSSNPTRTALQAAVFLLTRAPAERARYVCVVDSGIEPLSTLPYDVHDSINENGQAGDTGSNLWNTFQTLADLINAPGVPADPNKLDLSDTMIIITTDFGRTPFKSIGNAVNLASTGRDHWPQAYVNVLIGGPITTKAVIGSINDAPDLAGLPDPPMGGMDFSFSPTDVHAAAMVAVGINPFESENYAVGQLTASLTGISHEATMEKLRDEILV